MEPSINARPCKNAPIDELTFHTGGKTNIDSLETFDNARSCKEQNSDDCPDEDAVPLGPLPCNTQHIEPLKETEGVIYGHTNVSVSIERHDNVSDTTILQPGQYQYTGLFNETCGSSTSQTETQRKGYVQPPASQSSKSSAKQRLTLSGQDEPSSISEYRWKPDNSTTFSSQNITSDNEESPLDASEAIPKNYMKTHHQLDQNISKESRDRDDASDTVLKVVTTDTSVSTVPNVAAVRDDESTQRAVADLWSGRVEPLRHKAQHQVGLLTPPSSWAFNSFLVELSKRISQDELCTLKDMFIGEIGKGVLEGITRPSEFFRKLRERMFIDENNIVYLQAMLKVLDRPDLIKEAIDYCERTKDVLHFKPATNKPVNGYRYVKYHLCINSYHRENVMQVKNIVAEILCVPAQYILIAGVEPTASLLITLMMPKMYVEIFEEYLDHNALQHRFASMRIDWIMIGDKTYNISGTELRTTKQSDQQLVTLYQQLSYKTLALGVIEQKCNRLDEIVEDLEREVVDRDGLLKEIEEKCKEQENTIQGLEMQLEFKDVMIQILEMECVKNDFDEKIKYDGAEYYSSNEELDSRTTKEKRTEYMNRQLQERNEFLHKYNLQYLEKSDSSLNVMIYEKCTELLKEEEQMALTDTGDADLLSSLRLIIAELESEIAGFTVRSITSG